MGTHDDESLRRFLTLRRAGDGTGARRYWDELLTNNFDRVRTMVIAESHGRLSADEQQEAVQQALIRISIRLMETFRGSSMGEYLMAIRKLVHFTCIDVQRRATVISQRERPLQAARPGQDDDRDGLDSAVYAAIEKTRRERDGENEGADQLAEGREFLDWALPQLSRKRRDVLELDRLGLPVEEIQKRLGVSRDVVYASRSRALKDLDGLREQYGP